MYYKKFLKITGQADEQNEDNGEKTVKLEANKQELANQKNREKMIANKKEPLGPVGQYQKI